MTDFAPWRIARAELDSNEVQALATALKQAGKLAPEGGSPQQQRKLFPAKSTTIQKGAL